MNNDMNPHLSTKDIVEEISKTMGEIEEIDNELSSLFAERRELEDRVSNLPNIRSDIGNVESKAQIMASKLDKASLTANEISSQVRELDFAQMRVENVLQRVNLMLDLKETIKKVESLIDESKYSDAARQTYRLLHKNLEISQLTRNEEMKEEKMSNEILTLETVDEVSYEILLDLEKRLQTLIKEKCESALVNNELSLALEYCILYPYVGMSKSGLNIYCETVCQETYDVLKEQCLTLDSQPHKNAIIQHGKILEQFIDTIFTSIDDNSKTLLHEFGVGSMLTLIYHLYFKCSDIELPKLLTHYLTFHNIDNLTKSVKQWNDMESKRTMTSDRNLSIDDRFGQKVFEKMVDFFKIESKTLDERLDAIQHFCQELESFDNSVRELAKETLNRYHKYDKDDETTDNKNDNNENNNNGNNSESKHNDDKKDDNNNNKMVKRKRHSKYKKAAIDEKFLNDNPIFSNDLSNISRMRHELISNYIVLEQLNMQLQIQQIMTEDEILNGSKESLNVNNSNNNNIFDGKKTSNSAELIFYVLKKIAQRSFETYDINAACAIINHIYNCLDCDYKEWLDLLLRKEAGQGDQSYAETFYKSARNLYSMNAAEMISPQKSRKTVIILNNLDQSIRNVKRLKCELEEEMQSETFAGVSEKEKFQLRNCLDMLNECEKSFERIVDRGIFRFSQSYHDLFKPSFEKFKLLNYDMNEKDFAQSNYNNSATNTHSNISHSSHLNGNNNSSGSGVGAGGNNDGSHANKSNHGSFIQYLDDSIRPHLKALSMRLERDNFHRITWHILSYLLNELERMLLNHKFTFWGAMQFDQDRQALQAFFNENTKAPSIRDQFARLRQIATILQLTKLEDVTHYVNDPDLIQNQQLTTNTLTNDEIRKFLSLRKDFDVKRIHNLQL